jgi:hypothetical protein
MTLRASELHRPAKGTGLQTIPFVVVSRFISEGVMTFREKALYHQIHPVKLATDIGSGLISTWLMWRHELAWAVLVSFLPAILVSALMIRFMSFERQQHSALGRYVERWMTPATQAARLAGQVIMWLAGWRHSLPGVTGGLLLIGAAWTHGLLPRRHPN